MDPKRLGNEKSTPELHLMSLCFPRAEEDGEGAASAAGCLVQPLLQY